MCVMLPPIIDVRVLSSVVLTLSVVAVVVAASDHATVAVLLVFATTSVVDKSDAVVVFLRDIVGAIDASSDDITSVVVLSVVVLCSVFVAVAIAVVVPVLFAGSRYVV